MELNDLKASSIELGAYPCAFTQWNESIFSSSLSSLASAPFRWIYLSYQKMKLRAKRRINQFTHVQYARILFWTFFTQNAYHLIDFGLCSFTIFRLCVFLLGFFFCTLVSFIIVVHRLFRFEINLIENVVDPVYKYDIFIVVHRFKSNGVFSQVNAVSHLSNILYNIERHFSWIRFLFSAHIEVRSLSMLQRIFIYTHTQYNHGVYSTACTRRRKKNVYPITNGPSMVSYRQLARQFHSTSTSKLPNRIYERCFSEHFCCCWCFSSYFFTEWFRSFSKSNVNLDTKKVYQHIEIQPILLIIFSVEIGQNNFVFHEFLSHYLLSH